MDQTKLTPDFIHAHGQAVIKKLKKTLQAGQLTNTFLLQIRQQQLHKKDGILIQ